MQDTRKTSNPARRPRGIKRAGGQAKRSPAGPRASNGDAKRSYERYLALARDAAAAGDTIEAENLYQHAEHYLRTMREHGGQDERAAASQGLPAA